MSVLVAGLGGGPQPHLDLLQPTLLQAQHSEVALGVVVAGVGGPPIPRLGRLEVAALREQRSQVVRGGVVATLGGSPVELFDFVGGAGLRWPVVLLAHGGNRRMEAAVVLNACLAAEALPRQEVRVWGRILELACFL